jgi:hypothetical protein
MTHCPNTHLVSWPRLFPVLRSLRDDFENSVAATESPFGRDSYHAIAHAKSAGERSIHGTR